MAAPTNSERIIVRDPKDGNGEQQVEDNVETGERGGFREERERDYGAGDDIVSEIKQLQIREDERDKGEENATQPGAAVLLQPIFARGALQVADEVNEDGDDDGENVRRRERGNEERERGEESALQINNEDAGQQIGIKRGGPDGL